MNEKTELQKVSEETMRFMRGNYVPDEVPGKYNTQNFSGLAGNYTIGRPAYANAFIEDLYSKYGFSEQSVIADTGSGTGKFAKQLLGKGSFVYCVEPNDDMRNTAITELRNYKNFHAINGTDANTTIDDASVDYITVAQAFHWFDTLLFRQECRRIFRKNGLVFLIWNVRDLSNEINQKSYDIYAKYCPNFKGFSGGMQMDDPRIKEFFDGRYEYMEYDNPLFYDKEKFISRSLSGSYSLKQGDANYNEYIDELSQLFEQYAKDDILTMANKTVVYTGKII